MSILLFPGKNFIIYQIHCTRNNILYRKIGCQSNQEYILMYFTQSRHDYILRERGCLTSYIYVNELI